MVVIRRFTIITHCYYLIFDSGRVTEDKEEQDNHGNVTARSGEDMVDDLKKEEQSKRDFYTNISKWVDSVSSICNVQIIYYHRLDNDLILFRLDMFSLDILASVMC